MEQLKRSTVTNKNSFPAVTIGSMANMPERVLQFGEGNFLRAFVDWQFNELITSKLFNGSIVVIQPLAQGMVQQLNDQEGLYTVVQRGYENGTLIEKMDVITAISRGINPYTDYQEYIRCASNSDLRFVISNTTESGIEYVKQDKPTNICPTSYPAKIAILLYERFKTFKGDPSKGLILIPCELIEQNGDELKRCILQHAIDWKYEQEFIDWFEQSNYFCNTLVDRIVPGFPKEEIQALTKQFGYEDKLVVACEVFHKWVIQGNPIVQNELPFDKIGLNVVWTDDITPHRTLKVRILNGAHTTFTIPAFLSGKEFVKESMEDNEFGKFIQGSVFEEILPTLKFDQNEKEKFAAAVLERFRNPYIKHALISITLNSVSKYKVRVLPSLLEYQKLNNTLPQRLCIGLAALIRFYKPIVKNEKGYFGVINDKQYPIQDSVETVHFFSEQWSRNGKDLKTLVHAVLSHTSFWGIDLTTIPDLAKTIENILSVIDAKGIHSVNIS